VVGTRHPRYWFEVCLSAAIGAIAGFGALVVAIDPAQRLLLGMVAVIVVLGVIRLLVRGPDPDTPADQGDRLTPGRALLGIAILFVWVAVPLAAFAESGDNPIARVLLAIWAILGARFSYWLSGRVAAHFNDQAAAS
jgi:hypothetical protein